MILKSSFESIVRLVVYHKYDVSYNILSVNELMINIYTPYRWNIIPFPFINLFAQFWTEQLKTILSDD